MSSDTAKIRAVVVDRDHGELVRCSQILQGTGVVEVVTETTSSSVAPSLVERHKPDYLFLAVDPEHVSLIEKARAAYGAVKIVALGDLGQSELVLKCFRAGAVEFLAKPLHVDELLDVLSRLQQNTTVQSQEPKNMGKVIALCGSRGGSGVTTVACNLAHSLQEKHPTVLVDFHFGQGDLSVHMNAQSTFSLRDLSESGDRFDETLLETIVSRHASGLHFLPQPFDGQSYSIQDEILRTCIERLQAKYTYVVLDCGSGFYLIQSLAYLFNRLFLLVNQDVPSIFLAAQKMQKLMHTQLDLQCVDIIVNNYSGSRSVNLQRISKTINKKKLFTVRSDEKRVLSAINQGISLSEVSRWGRAYKDINKIAQNLIKLDGSALVSVEDTKKVENKILKRGLLPQITLSH